ncbi:MAG: M48 family metalloprotease [Pseudomonadota bacterium]
MTDVAVERYPAPAPTPYHKSLSAGLERREAGLWKWFASEEVSEDAANALHLELLKTTYRLDRKTHEGLYADADRIAKAMALEGRVTLYQAEGGDRRNAALYFEPNAVHVVFSGDLLKTLDPDELKFLLGHEFAHHKLWTLDGGRVWAAHRLVNWAAAEPGAPAAFSETARLERLYTEIYADRYGLWAVGDLEPAIRALVKIVTGIDEVSGAEYLNQARDALAMSETAARDSGAETGSQGLTHPESYLRAETLACWAQEDGGDHAEADRRARRLIEGETPLNRLDLLGQERLQEIADWLLLEFLGDPWNRRELIQAHARLISPRLGNAILEPRGEEEDLERLRAAITNCHPTIRDAFAYLLLDFATIDPDLDDVPLAAALMFADDFGLRDPLRKAANKELKISMGRLDELERKAPELVRGLSSALRDKAAGQAPQTTADEIAGDAA